MSEIAGSVQVLLRIAPSLIHRHLHNGNSCLIMACDMGHVAIVRLLLAAGGRRLLSVAMTDGMTCLHAACYRGYSEVAVLLLDAEGGNELLHRADRAGKTCLHSACHSGDPALLRLLLARGGDALLHRADASGNTCLMSACMFCPLDSVKLLVQAGGPLLASRHGANCSMTTPLNLAISSGRQDVADYLMSVPGMSPPDPVDVVLGRVIAPVIRRGMHSWQDMESLNSVVQDPSDGALDAMLQSLVDSAGGSGDDEARAEAALAAAVAVARTGRRP
jgi:hypothetical protein